ncbi:CHRNN [Mytilus coruscus]|uniref:CHRNN n=1 Tax=Mytilus coruscus TaxID=42192 RepID=A0A6J8F3S4_MYTCO|nr:CHRNN [Mytilus coruscus]
MGFIKSVLIFFYCTQLRYLVIGQTYDEISSLERQLKQFSPDLNPRLNQKDPVDVSIMAYITAILDYNEVSGTLQPVVSYVLTWRDEVRRWNSSEYGNVTSINLPITNTWIPKISIINMVRHKSIFMYHNEMEIRRSLVNYQANGFAEFHVSGAQDITCSSEVKYFPFDSHACSIQLFPEYANGNVILKPETKTFDLRFAVSNTEWSITANSVDGEVVPNVFSIVRFNITLSRNPSFLFLNLVLPIVLLSFANLLVFCIPVASGERGSLAFTILLTFIVFITMVTDILPACKPISYFNIFLEVQLFCSVLIAFCTVWSISLHHRFAENYTQDIFPQFLLQMSCAYRNSCSKQQQKGKKNQVVPPRGLTKEHCNETCVDKNRQLQNEQELHEDIRSDNIYTKDNHQYCLKCIDSICFSLFLIILCIQLSVYGIIFLYKP